MLGPLIMALTVACSPFAPYDTGCSPPPKASDAATPVVWIECREQTCGQDNEGIRGTDPHIMVGFDCPGESEPFLVAVKVDGALVSMRETECAVYGWNIRVDMGSWDPVDTSWHEVEVILDAMNLFDESDESNNRVKGRIRVVEPAAPAANEPAGQP